jgi:hypothetical protein
MKYTMLAATTAFAVSAAITAHAGNERSPYGTAQPARSNATAEVVDTTGSEAGSSVSSFNALLAELERAGFVAPSKPSQYRVFGRNGYVTNGPGYNVMVALIRSAVNDSDKGTIATRQRKLRVQESCRQPAISEGSETWEILDLRESLRSSPLCPAAAVSSEIAVALLPT